MSAVGQPRVESNHAPEEVVGDGYRILGVLGTGGIATTYIAEDPQGKQVALKQLFLWRRHDWKTFELFEREARVLAHLAHPGIPRFIDFFRVETPDGPCFYLAQEIAVGRTLKAWIDSGYRPTEDFVRGLADQLLGILEYLHALRPPVIHRDIKPANLIWRADGTLALVDFGAVRDTDREKNDGSTIVGTYGFMAPEQFRGHAVPETDLYGVGATCAYLLTGKNPADLPEQNGQPKLNAANVSRAFRGWIERLLSRDPAHRYPSATEARAALKETQNAPARGEARRPRALAVAGAATAMAVAAVALKLAFSMPVSKVKESPQPAHGAAPVSQAQSTGKMKWVRNFIGHWSALFDIAVDPTSRFLVTASNDGTAKIWNLETAVPVRSLTGHQGPRVNAVAITRDGKNVVTGSEAVRVFDFETGSLLRTMDAHQGNVTSVAVSADGTEIVSTGANGTAYFWDFASGKELGHFQAPKRCIWASWSPDGDHAAVGCDDGKIYVLGRRTATPVRIYEGHAGPIDELVYSSDGKTLVSASDDHTIRIWSEPTPKPIAILTGHTDEVWGISLSPDGKTLVSGSKDGTLRLWDVYGAKQIDVMPLDKILKVRFLADGERFIAAQANGVAALFTLGVASWQPPKITSPIPHPPRVPPPSAPEDEKLCLEAQQQLDEAKPGSHFVSESKRLANLALEKNPNSAFAHAVLARAAYRGGYLHDDEYDPKSLELAQAEVDRALALDQKLPIAHVVGAYVQAFQKNLPRANESAARARQLDPKNVRVIELSAFLAVKNGDYDEAFALCRSIVETTSDPDFLARAYSTLVDVYTRRTDWNAVEDVHRSLVNLDSGNAFDKGNLANFLVWRGKYDEAIDWAKRAIAQADYGYAHVTLADAYAGKALKLLQATGPTPEVESLIDEAENASSRSAETFYARGLLHRALGNPVRAALAFRMALKIKPDHAGAKAALEK